MKWKFTVLIVFILPFFLFSQNKTLMFESKGRTRVFWPGSFLEIIENGVHYKTRVRMSGFSKIDFLSKIKSEHVTVILRNGLHKIELDSVPVRWLYQNLVFGILEKDYSYDYILKQDGLSRKQVRKVYYLRFKPLNGSLGRKIYDYKYRRKSRKNLHKKS